MAERNCRFRTVAEVVKWCESAPASTTIGVADVAQILTSLVPVASVVDSAPAAPAALETSWREKLWSAPPETRLGVPEAAEALGRSRNYIYRLTGKNAGDARLPHRKLDGELEFLVGELRAWLQAHEEVVAAPRGSGHSHARLAIG